MGHDTVGSDPSSDDRDLDLTRASAARVYDFWLGGGHNFAVDREVGQQIVDTTPQVPAAAQANRAFLRRVTEWCVDNGITQFLDLGSGIPTIGNVHEIAQRRDPRARVAYVDNEPVAVSHSTNLLWENPTTTITDADLRNPREVLTAPGVAGLLDFQAPIALLALLVLQYFPNTGEVTALIRQYREALPAGSVVVLSHVTDDDPAMPVAEATRLSQQTDNPTYSRNRDEFAALFGDAPLIEPGIVFAQHWHPDPNTTGPEHTCVYTAAAHA